MVTASRPHPDPLPTAEGAALSPFPPLTGVGCFDCFRLKPMIRNQLAKHLGFITRKGRGPFLVVKERRDVSPRSTLRLDRRGRYSVPTSEQAASGRLGSLELRHRSGSS